jgi:hypothetical protein
MEGVPLDGGYDAAGGGSEESGAYCSRSSTHSQAVEGAHSVCGQTIDLKLAGRAAVRSWHRRC